MGKNGFSEKILAGMLLLTMLSGCAKQPDEFLLPDKSDYAKVSETIDDSSESSIESETVSEPVSDSEQSIPDESEEIVIESEAAEESEQPSNFGETSEDSKEPESEYKAEEESSGESFALWSPDTGKVSENGEVGSDYFSDAVFIGNSRMEGFVLYSGLTLHALTGVGLTVATAYNDQIFSKTADEKQTLVDAIGNGTVYQKYYLMFGLNELGWSSYATFTKDYGGIVDRILSVNPSAQIYLVSILPLTAEKSSESSWLNNQGVNTFNKLIWQLAADKGVYYLDAASTMRGTDGCLPENWANDGIHLNKTACQVLLAYFKTHTA